MALARILSVVHNLIARTGSSRGRDMTWYRTLALLATTIAVSAAQSMSLNAQAASPPRQVPSVAVSLAMEKDHVPVGQKPRVFLTFKNSSHQEIGLSIASHLYRVHVDGAKGEAPETEWQRHHLHGVWRPGDGPELMEGPNYGIDIAPESSNSRVYDLTRFYDLSVPGKYTVYVEVYDQSGPQDGSGNWLRTNTVQFKMVPPPH
jgi:hypothetical protein